MRKFMFLISKKVVDWKTKSRCSSTYDPEKRVWGPSFPAATGRVGLCLASRPYSSWSGLHGELREGMLDTMNCCYRSNQNVLVVNYQLSTTRMTWEESPYEVLSTLGRAAGISIRDSYKLIHID